MAVTLFFRQTSSLPEDVDAVKANGAEGIGLYRTEFLYLNRETLPSEEEQYRDLSKGGRARKPRIR